MKPREPKLKRRDFLKLGLFGGSSLLFAAPAFAQEAGSPIAASSNAREKWLALSPEQKTEMRERWQRFKKLPPEKREHMRLAFRRFRDLPPDRQERIRKNWRRWRALPEERRRHIRQRMVKWRSLTPERRQQLREQFRMRRQRRRGG